MNDAADPAEAEARTTPPFSDLASPSLAASAVRVTEEWHKAAADAMESWDLLLLRSLIHEHFLTPGLARMRQTFDVTIESERIGGVPVDVVRPASGVSSRNADRVLLNLHGGGFTMAAGIGGQQESVPIAALGEIEVVTVDYRQAPEFLYPAANEDIAAVYRALLERYEPSNIGIYGCSAGGYLSAATIPWFDSVGLPRPAAIGVFGMGASVGIGLGDGAQIAAFFENSRPRTKDEFPYFDGAPINDPLISPEEYDDLLATYPPTLVISGTRDARLSRAIRFHSRLVRNGVDARLHVWEGIGHCSFAQGPMDPETPEIREVWDVIVRFFDRTLHGDRSG
jgi:acetyl esterase/lipase